MAIMDREKDSLRIYNLGNHYGEKITHHGVKPGYDPGGSPNLAKVPPLTGRVD